MNWRPLLVIILVVATIAALLRLERGAQTELRERIRALRQQVERWAQSAPTRQTLPEGVASAETVSQADAYRELLRLRGEAALLRRQGEELDKLRAENLELHSNLLARVLNHEVRELTPDQIQSYLENKGRSAESLLTAFEISRDKALLQDAVEKYPNDPRVSMIAALAKDFKGDCRQSLEAFKQSAPENALANYLSAQAYFKSGQADLALQELTAAGGKTRLEDYAADFLRSAEEAYSAAGYPEAAAKAAAWSHQSYLTPLNGLAELRRSLGDLVNAYRQAGDEESARAALQLGVNLGRRLADEPLGLRTEYHESLGLLLQRRLLETLDPASPHDGQGHTVKDRLDELARRRADIKQFSDPDAWDGYLLRTLSEQDLLSYFDRLKNSSELEARRWAVSRQAKQ